jgi:hypothetical protein
LENQLQHRFPKDAYVGDVKRPYKPLGLVKSRVDFSSLDERREEDALCKNYYNKAVEDLLKRAREKGADAVIDVKSVVFLEDGRMETYATPECADDGHEGQILAQGIAVQWKQAEASSAGEWALNESAGVPAAPQPKRRVKLPKAAGDLSTGEARGAASPLYTPGYSTGPAGGAPQPEAPVRRPGASAKPQPARPSTPVQRPASQGWVPDITPNSP